MRSSRAKEGKEGGEKYASSTFDRRSRGKIYVANSYKGEKKKEGGEKKIKGQKHSTVTGKRGKYRRGLSRKKKKRAASV